ncbi:MAG: geranylgeranyl reductase family protein [Anaerolineae bacterium]
MISVDQARCCYCGGCVSVCPEDALHLAGTHLQVSQACTECGLCLPACPVGALSDSPDRRADTVPPPFRPHYDIIVAGAGPGGSMAAWEAARQGLTVLLLEKRQEIGSPVRCAEAVPPEALAVLVDPDPAWISAHLSLAQIITREGGRVVHKWQGSGGTGYVLERRVFDRMLAEQAAQAGAQVQVKTPVVGLLHNSGTVGGVIAEWQGRRYEIEASIVIAADGIESRVGAWAGLDTRLEIGDTMTCAQYLLAGIDWDPSCMGCWIDQEVAPGGYAWVFPKGEGRANVGLGLQADLAEATALSYLERFIEGEPALRSGTPVTLIAANVPVSPPCSRLVTNGVMLVGDAARQVDALTGGGIIHAMTAGKLAAQVAAQALDRSDVSAHGLAAYEQQVEQAIGRKLARSYRLRETFAPEERSSRRFLRLFAVATGSK